MDKQKDKATVSSLGGFVMFLCSKPNMIHATVALLRFDAKKGEGGERELGRRFRRGLDNDHILGHNGDLGLGLAAAK